MFSGQRALELTGTWKQIQQIFVSINIDSAMTYSFTIKAKNLWHADCSFVATAIYLNIVYSLENSLLEHVNMKRSF